MPRIPVNMPKMSMTMEFGTVVEWLVEVGGQVKNGDAIAVVTTDKVDMEVEATLDGVLLEVLAQPGDEVPVGQPIAYVDSEAEDLLGDLFATPPAEAPAGAPAGSDAPPASEPAAPAAEPAPAEAAAGSTDAPDRPRVVPLGRRLAAEAGLDLRGIEPSGPGRTIRARDVREAIAARDAAGEPAPAAAPSAAPVPTPDAAPPVAAAEPGSLLGDAKTRRMRIATAKVMDASAVIPQFTAYRVLDLTRLAKARKASLKGISWTSILVRAYAMVLREYPQLNGYWAGQGVSHNPQVGVSLAVDTPTGLLAPVLADPDRVALRELDRRIRELADQVKAGRLDPTLFAGGTGTVSNLGGMGVDRFNALLTPPQTTALSLGAVVVRPVFGRDAEVVAQTCCEVGLTIDHRSADGADAARALQTLQDYLDDPFLLLA